MCEFHDFHEFFSEILQMRSHLLFGLSGPLGAHGPDDPLVLDDGFFYTSFQCEHAQFHLVPLRIEILNDLPGTLIVSHCKQQGVQLAIGNEPFVQPRLFLSFAAGTQSG